MKKTILILSGLAVCAAGFNKVRTVETVAEETLV